MTDSSDNLGMASMKPVEPPESGYDTGTPQTITDLNHIPVAYGRDAQTDCRRISDVEGGNIAGDGDHDDVGRTAGGWLSDMDVTSIGNEKRRAGWDPLATPFGATPHPVTTNSTRGADDIKPLPTDPTAMPDGT